MRYGVIKIDNIVEVSVHIKERGNLSLAIALGIILIFISIMLNYIVISIKNISKQNSYD